MYLFHCLISFNEISVHIHLIHNWYTFFCTKNPKEMFYPLKFRKFEDKKNCGEWTEKACTYITHLTAKFQKMTTPKFWQSIPLIAKLKKKRHQILLEKWFSVIFAWGYLTGHSLTERSQSQISKQHNEMEFFRMTFWLYEDFAK